MFICFSYMFRAYYLCIANHIFVFVYTPRDHTHKTSMTTNTDNTEKITLKRHNCLIPESNRDLHFWSWVKQRNYSKFINPDPKKELIKTSVRWSMKMKEQLFTIKTEKSWKHNINVYYFSNITHQTGVYDVDLITISICTHLINSFCTAVWWLNGGN